jgi:SAM-dependent methyltransferase
MSLLYRVMYAVGFKPWDTGEVPAELKALIEGESALAPGRALDVGCGTGTQSVYLASRGWDVTGVDAVARPLRRARARAAAEGVIVEWLRGDITRLPELGVRPGITFVFDRGCFHGLRPAERAAYAAGVSAVCTPGASLLMMSVSPNRVLGAPPGADPTEIESCFAGWELGSREADSGPAPNGPLRDVPRWWYRLRRTTAGR